jgi:predicted amidohydrolase YtcJ
MPTVDELNAAVPDKPAFLLFLYSGGMLNKVAMKELGINEDSVAPEGSRYERDAKGMPTGLLVADPNPMILYKTIAALPHMSDEEQYNSSLHYYRKLLSLGVTSVIDAGGGGHQFPDNYQASTAMAINGDLPIRIANYLFPQQPKQELNQYAKWMSNYKQNQNLDGHKHNGYVIEGGGELLVWSASDYENFTASRPDLKPEAEAEIEQVIRLHVLMGWPFRIHATYDESISRMLNVLEKVNRDQSLSKVRWAFDHAETISDANLARVKALGGGIAVQGRMAFAGEYFLERYGKEQTLRSPPIKKMLEMGIPVGLGTDGTRVSSFNPWASYYWTVSGRTVGGTRLYGDENRLDRLTALKLFTQGSAWFSSEELEKGQIKPGQLADFALLDRDILKVDEKQLLNTQSILTVVDGKVRYASDEYKALSPALPKAIPEWSPVNYRP